MRNTIETAEISDAELDNVSGGVGATVGGAVSAGLEGVSGSVAGDVAGVTGVAGSVSAGAPSLGGVTSHLG
ncbi:MAG TPA: hypothetical protein VNS49_00080 [Streptomyces sp.]|nr:hypothetical protein [Streptomyces sp.]